MLMIDPNFGNNLYPFYSLVASDWYESFSQFVPSPDYLQIVRGRFPLSWAIHQGGIWTHTYPIDHESPKQGWKIHISTRSENSKQILEICTDICVQHEVAFKFLADPLVFSIIMDKASARESGGKFITIYPSDVQHFRRIADDLCESLDEFKGPYILSDKRYKNSEVVYYRYGAFTGTSQISIFGQIENLLQDPNGSLIEDGRSPFFNPPSWIPNPFDSDEDEVDLSQDPGTIYLQDEKYLIEVSMHFSITGGVYKAIDMDTGQHVIIKEARPHTHIGSDGLDAVERLRKEHRLLKRLSGTGVAPEPLDIFEEWEHLFVVEEFIEGNNLFDVATDESFSTIESDPKNRNLYVEGLYKIFANLAHVLKIVHEHNIIVNDISPGNIILHQEEETLRLIDLEGAWEVGVDAPYTLFGTQGFRPPKGVQYPSDDIYGMGRIMFSLISPVTSLINIKPTATQIFLDGAENSGILPSSMKELILECMNIEENERPSEGELLNRLNNMSIDTHTQLGTNNLTIDNALLTDTVDEILKYIKSHMSFNRTDRLFPADPSVFATNPLSVAHGAAGVAYALSSLEGEVSDQVVTWMLSQEISSDKYPPGLYIGLSGIAWVFWHLEQQKIALQLMKTAAEHPLLGELPDIYYGAAGFGLACLYFHKETQDEYWLEQAVKVGDRLIDTMEETEAGYYWPDTEGNIWCSYARGQSGIALYLLYLNLASGESRFQDAGRRTLSYELEQVQETEQGSQIRRAASDSPDSIHKHVAAPYWADGSAGLCTSLVRYWAVFKDDEYKDTLDALMPDTAREITAFPTLFTGLAGLGNAQLDLWDFTSEPKYIEMAFKITKWILQFQMEKPDGIAFPGEQLLRISNDFGSGSAGIAMFLNRLANREKKFQNFNFLLDDLLCTPK